jgi:hypothetical protein
MERAWRDCVSVIDPPQFIYCSRSTLRRIRNRCRNPLKRPGSRRIKLTDDQAMELDVLRFAQGGFWCDRYVRMYDRRRVRRAFRRFKSRWHKIMPAYRYLRLPRDL